MDTTTNLRSILNIMLSLGGLAMGMVLSIVNAAILLGSILIGMDRNMLALTWIMIAFVFAAGFGAAKKQLEEREASLQSA